MYMLIMHTHECANARSGDRGEIARGRKNEGRVTRAKRFLSAWSRNGEGRKRVSPNVLVACREIAPKGKKSRKNLAADRIANRGDWAIRWIVASSWRVYRRSIRYDCSELVSNVFLNVVFFSFDLHLTVHASCAEAKLETVRNNL